MKEYLPVGSVVLLNKGEKELLIIGYKVVSIDHKAIEDNKEVKTDKVYDYCAVPYPEGIISSDIMLMFNHEDIKDILFTGYTTEESNKIKEFLNSDK